MRLTDRVTAVLDRRLDAESAAPVCVGLSGGGDSVALLALAADWARPRGRPVLALTVDHGLNPDSKAWTRFAAEAAARLGASWRALAWSGDKPTTGLPAAARAARHALLADAARAAGAGVILLGHTEDDVAEGALMRAEGSSLGRLREWSPSPAWPEGRGVFLLRPMLGVRRHELRDFLGECGLDWIEDPANADPRFARARARARLSAKSSSDLITAHPDESRGPGVLDAMRKDCGKSLGPGFRRDERVESLARACADDGAGGFAIARAVLREVDGDASRRFVSAAVLCAAGGTRPPRGDALARLVERLRGEATFTAALAGARVEADADRIRFLREAGERARGGLAVVGVTPGVASVWDGRFEIVSDVHGQIRPLAGLAAALDPAERADLARVPAAARAALPVLVRDGETRPVLAATAARVRVLARERLLGACGVIAHERENGVSAHGVFNFASLCSGTETSRSPGNNGRGLNEPA